jgi:hypothetical protein
MNRASSQYQSNHSINFIPIANLKDSIGVPIANHGKLNLMVKPVHVPKLHAIDAQNLHTIHLFEPYIPQYLIRILTTASQSQGHNLPGQDVPTCKIAL